jgi:release factor glutamine methyltransferase
MLHVWGLWWFDSGVATLRDILADYTARLKSAGVDSPRLNAELILAHALGTDRAGLRARLQETPEPDVRSHADTLLARRVAREPVDYIVGEREFYGRRFLVRPGVLIPRPETEAVIEHALRELDRHGEYLAADVGCGSGAIAVTLALEFPRMRVLATDISRVALSVTRENAEQHGVAARVQVACMDCLSAAAPGLDLIAANPPYIAGHEAAELEPEVRDHEPPEALFAEADGLAVAKRVVAETTDRLKPGGLLLLEHGYTQGKALRECAVEAGLTGIQTLKDFADLDRLLRATK